MLNKIDEIRLIAKCTLLDDRDAFGKLVEAFQTDIRRFFINLTGDVCLSDDLAQETFIKAYLSLGSFKGLSSFRTWIYRIAYNEFYDWTRKRKEDRYCDESPAETPCESSENYNGIKIDVENAILKLSPAERTVVILFFMEDKTIREISRITAMPEGTVKSHLSRAKTRLAGLLENY